MLKSDFTEYVGKKPEVYVDFEADAIAEPSDPLRTVDMLKELPVAMADLYRDEAKVLEGGVEDPDVLSDVDKRYRRVVGHHREWRKYLHRPECEFLWSWILEPEVRARCAVAAVKTNQELSGTFWPWCQKTRGGGVRTGRASWACSEEMR